MRDYKDDKFIKQIIKAVNERKLIIFVGAGVSRLCGLPSWDQAANDLLEYCTKYCDDFNYAKILLCTVDMKTNRIANHNMIKLKCL